MDTERFYRENYVERRGTDTLRWGSLQEIFGDAELLPLWVADMETQSPAAMREALVKRVEHGMFGYGRVEDSYFDSFFVWQKKHRNVEYVRENVRFATEVVDSLYAAVRAYTKEEASVIIYPPICCPFYDTILNTGRKLVTCELDSSNDCYTLDFEKFEEEITDNKIGMFILCSPHNPISRVWSEKELDIIFDVCRRHGVLVISGEIHQDLTYEGRKFVSFALVGDGKHKDTLITLNARPKTFNPAGLIHSHVIIFDKQLMETYDAYIRRIDSAEVNLMGTVGVEAAFRGGEEWLDHVKTLVMHNYSYMKQELARELLKIAVTPSEGIYLSWIDLRGYLTGEETADFIRTKCRLACDVREWFNLMAQGFIRISLTTDKKNIVTAVESIIRNIEEEVGG